MRPLLSTGISLAFLTAVGIGACTDAGTDSTTTSTNPPAADEPAQTGSLPAEPAVPADPAAPAEEPAPAQ